MSRPLRVLVVCTANICRSPAAEHYLRHHAAERGLDVEVSSAGFLYDDESASDTMAKVMGERGFDLSAHRSRVVDCDLVDAVDLVVTMERRHGRELVSRCGPRGVFTLRGAVAAIAAVDGDRSGPVARIEAADADRLPGDLLGSGDDEVPDPFGKSLRVNRRAADDLHDLTAALLDALY
ncbi:MAG: hypothetical protein AAGA90_17945 [Actinomycetota bacterium]